MGVAGTVICATDLNENKQKSGGGKGRPSVTSYSYSVSLAVAISIRPIFRVGRIWAEGNMLSGVAGGVNIELGEFRHGSGGSEPGARHLDASSGGTQLPLRHRGQSCRVEQE